PDAEDAFQVAFMVLARKAASVRPPGRVAAWMHGVASLAARKARAARCRRFARELNVDALAEPAAPAAGAAPELAEVLDAELARLPDKYRLPIVLCELRELTTAQAAAEIAWPVGTVASRLSRGRQLLARRLRRLDLPSGAFLPAAAPTRLVTETVSAAVAGGSGSPAAAPALFHEVIRAM